MDYTYGIMIPLNILDKGHSTSSEQHRSGKEDLRVVQKELKKLGIKPTPRATTLSLEIIQMIHPCITRYGKKEAKNYLKYLGDEKILGTISGGIPSPESSTSIITPALVSLLLTVIFPTSPIASMALVKRFMNTT